MFDDSLKTAATLLAVFLPTITALFAFRASERKEKVLERNRQSLRPVDYSDPMKRIAEAIEVISQKQERQINNSDRHSRWRQDVLDEIIALRRAVDRMASALKQ